MDYYAQFLREKHEGKYSGCRYPNLVEIHGGMPTDYFAEVTKELMLAVFRGEEDLTLEEISRIARYNGITLSVLTCPKVIMLDMGRRRHRKMVAEVDNYNSGGHNKTHGRVEEYSRIDSFSLLRYADWFERLSDYGECHYPVMGGMIFYNLIEDTARISHNRREYPLRLSKVPNVDGISYRLYFLCPKCGKRVRHLYKKNMLYQCRKCAKLNYGIQQRSGLNLLRRKMYWLVVKKLQYIDWEVDHPDLPIQDLWHIPKPRYMRWAKYDVLMEEYRRLQKEYETMYNESLMKAFERINKLLG